jgi:hypothetical protein
MLSVDLTYKVTKMSDVQRLDSMYGVGNSVLDICYHQCIKCGKIFGCKLVRVANTCGNPFYHGRCSICNGTV